MFSQVFRKTKATFQDVFLLVKLKNILVHLTHNNYLKKGDDKVFWSGKEMDVYMASLIKNSVPGNFREPGALQGMVAEVPYASTVCSLCAFSHG